MILYAHHYTVSGTGRFPIDMLRYDGSHPRTQRGSYVIESTFNGDNNPTFVVLERFGDKNWKPEPDRWESFRWSVAKHVRSRRVS